MGNFGLYFEKIAEERIREAMERGEFENLEGSGLPIKYEDDSHLPEELRIAYKVLKNADCLPPELELRKEIVTTEKLLSGIRDEEEKYRQMKKLNYLIMKLNMMRSVSPLLEEGQHYYEKVTAKVTVAKKDAPSVKKKDGSES